MTQLMFCNEQTIIASAHRAVSFRPILVTAPRHHFDVAHSTLVVGIGGVFATSTCTSTKTYIVRRKGRVKNVSTRERIAGGMRETLNKGYIQQVLIGTKSFKRFYKYLGCAEVVTR